MVQGLKAVTPPFTLPSEANIQIDARVLLFTLIISVLTGIVFGLAPALQAAKPDLAGSMKEGAADRRRAVRGSSSRRARDRRGSVSVGADGTYSFGIPLVASRDGGDIDGRTYTINITGSDKAGNAGSCSTVVTIAHDQGH